MGISEKPRKFPDLFIEFALAYRAGTGACPYNIYRKQGTYFLKNP
jgi:hypothetical protein